ncbi:unnamed protein product [Brassicogethes aeneus]|uniref:Carboxylic ester hydrolase n=1 Tax=Brassicogethes aeneus TaxID=1431903 RepID=A0A9P0FC43_BRAAE|nr:unnamed protein product [Brassicogethes aeneus]
MSFCLGFLNLKRFKDGAYFYRRVNRMCSTIVTISDGQIKGKSASDERGGTYFSFQGIPYAKPPVGNLRFRDPQPLEKWTGVLDATKQRKGCFSRKFLGSGFIGREDCLILNVYTPNTKEDSSPKPVLFWIHGGGFTSGSSTTDLYGPEYLMPENVVLVTINYRLGALGFLKFDDPSLEVPGNAGLKDMVMALKWVQKHIKNFGGDPNNVTIFGESAGGAAVQYLMLSPSSKGLFHKAILQSGSALNPWASGDPDSTKKLAKVLGLNPSNEREVLDKLQSMKVEDLFTNGVTKLKDSYSPGQLRPFCPLLDCKSCFVSKDPVDAIQSGNYHKVPMLMGCTSDEGMLIHFLTPKKHLTSETSFIPQNMKVQRGSPLYKEVAHKIKKYYLGDDLKATDFYRLFTDNYFLLGVYRSAKHHIETNDQPIYFYRFSLDTELNFLKRLLDISDPGACHVEDIAYLFKGATSPDLKPGSIEETSVRRMTKMWTDFARFGNPTPNTNTLIPTKWLPITKEKFNYLRIEKDLKMDVDLERESMEFWSKVEDDLKFKNKL